MIIAVVGMPGSGKTEAVKVLESLGFAKVYFGGLVIEEVKKRGLEVNEKNERIVREDLRKKHGMEAMAKLSLPKIEELLNVGKNIVIDGLYSWEEYKFLKSKYPEMIVIHIYASPKTRYKRLSERPERPLTPEECKIRDTSQIENLHTGGPIAMADAVIINEKTLDDLEKKIEKLVRKLESDL